MVVGLISAHIAGGLADNHGQLALVMHERHVGWTESAGAVADEVLAAFRKPTGSAGL